jgi:hypothetical protein
MTIKMLSILRTSQGLDEFPILRELLRRDINLSNFDDRNYSFHAIPNFAHRLARKLNRTALHAQFNADIMANSRISKPDIMFFFKASGLAVETIRLAKSLGTKVIGFYPDMHFDTQAYAYMLGLCDKVYHAKPNRKHHYEEQVNLHSECLMPLYDSRTIGVIEAPDPELGVSYVGHANPNKIAYLHDFAAHYEGRLSIFGNDWKQQHFHNVRADVVLHPALYGDAVAQVYRRSFCMLGYMQVDDVITSRTMVVPCNGGLLVHEYREEIEKLYGAVPALIFHNTQDLVQKVQAIAQDAPMRYSLAAQQQAIALAHGTSEITFVDKILGL